MEEAGIAIDGCEYHSSQPWPFPSSIMLGFWATARRGEVRVDGSELEEALWVHRDQVLAQEVRLPPKLSIARRLIDDWLRQAEPARARRPVESENDQEKYRPG
jgi:NAD+ diphosphatase